MAAKSELRSQFSSHFFASASARRRLSHDDQSPNRGKRKNRVSEVHGSEYTTECGTARCSARHPGSRGEDSPRLPNFQALHFVTALRTWRRYLPADLRRISFCSAMISACRCLTSCRNCGTSSSGMLPVNVRAGLSRTNRRTSIIRSGCMAFSLRKKSLAPLGSFLMFLLMGKALGPDSSLKGVDLRLASCTRQTSDAALPLRTKYEVLHALPA